MYTSVAIKMAMSMSLTTHTVQSAGSFVGKQCNVTPCLPFTEQPQALHNTILEKLSWMPDVTSMFFIIQQYRCYLNEANSDKCLLAKMCDIGVYNMSHYLLNVVTPNKEYHYKI